MANEPAHVLILGAGFGGLAAARALARAPVRITIIDRENHHTFQPLLYQVATASLSAPQIAAPIRQILRRQQNCTVLMDDASCIDPAARQVHLTHGVIAYDYLIIATGATHAYFGHDDWAAHAPGLKTMDDALAMRQRLLLAFERAESTDDLTEREALLNFVIVGAGPTGVELAGTLAEIAHHTLPSEFKRANPRAARITLVEGGPRVLSAYPERLSASAERQLRELGVSVRTGAIVTAIDADGVAIGTERVSARTVFWAAGVAASPLARTVAASDALDRAGRIRVEPTLTVPGQDRIFAIGDIVSLSIHGESIPGVAPAAKQMGQLAAQNILAHIVGAPLKSFRYRDYGAVATIGRGRAIADFSTLRPRIQLTGLAAWLFWLLLHVFFLIGFRNRIVVMLDWAWAYMTFERHARLILGRRQHPPWLP